MKHLSLKEMIEAMNCGNANEHLRTCPECLGKAETLARLAVLSKKGKFLEGTRSGGCPSSEEIAETVEGTASLETAAAVNAHIGECDGCFLDAAWYRSAGAAMEEQQGGIAEAPRRYVDRALKLVAPDKLSWLDRWIYAPFPAYASLALLLVVLFTAPEKMSVSHLDGGTEYAVYAKSDNQTPYLFFGASGERISSIDARMEEVPLKRELRFVWSAVPGVKEYHFVLQDIGEVAPKTVLQTSTANNFLQIPWKRFEEGKKYRWIAAGATGHDSYFRGVSEFVAVRN